jgi:hypothetical protein
VAVATSCLFPLTFFFVGGCELSLAMGLVRRLVRPRVYDGTLSRKN